MQDALRRYQYFLFNILLIWGGAYAPNPPPLPTGLNWSSVPLRQQRDASRPHTLQNETKEKRLELSTLKSVETYSKPMASIDPGRGQMLSSRVGVGVTMGDNRSGSA